MKTTVAVADKNQQFQSSGHHNRMLSKKKSPLSDAENVRTR